VIAAIQQKVDTGIDFVVAWVVKQAKALFGKGGEKEEPHDQKWDAGVAGVSKDVDAMPAEEKTEEGLGKRIPDWKKTYGFTELTVVHSADGLELDGAMSPGKKVKAISAAAGTPPEYGSLTNGYGTYAKVQQMGTKPTGGSSASQTLTSAGWQALIKRRNDNTGSSSYYVKGHLLNNHLGGPGDVWKNLTPLTQEGNNRSGDSMYYAFEKKVKDAVFTEKRPVTGFQVTAIYGAPGRASELAAIDKEMKKPGTPKVEADRLQAVRDVVAEEQNIPTKVQCEATLGVGGSATKSEKLSVPVDNDFRTVTWDKYKVRP